MTEQTEAAVHRPVPAGAAVRVVRASALMAAGTLVSRILGFVRAFLLAAVLGATAQNLAAGAFDVANKLPNVLYLLIAGGALNAVLVPQIVRADSEGEAGRERLDSLLTYSVAGLAILTVALTVLAGPLVDLYETGFTPDQEALAVALAWWALPQVFFYGLYALLGQVLNARGSFGPYTWAPVANNVVAIIGLALVLAVTGPLKDRLPGDIGQLLVVALAGTATLGVAVQALVLVPAVRATGLRFRPRWRLRGAGLSSAGSVAAWVFASIVVSQLAYVVFNNVATAAAGAAIREGVADRTASNATWSFAFLLFMLPHGLIAVSVVTAQFTSFARTAGAGDGDALRRDARDSVRQLLVGMALPAAALFVLSQPAAMLLFGGDAGQGLAIGSVLTMMAVGLPSFSATYQLQRVFYALTDGRTPFVISASTSALWALSMAVIWVAAPPQWIVPGAALALAGTQVLSCALLVVAVSRRLGGIGVAGIASVAARATVAAAAAIGVTTLALRALGAGIDGWPLPGADSVASSVLPVLGGGVLVVAVYALAAWALRLTEAMRIGRILVAGSRRAVRRVTRRA